MGLFSKPEVVILKESSDAKQYLGRLEELREQLPDTSKILKELDKEIMMVKAGIDGEDAIMFELKNSGMDLVVLHDIYIEAPSGNGAQIDFYVIAPHVSVIIECKNLYGNIEINNKGDFIRTISYGGKSYKEGIYSPITQNERHLQILKECKLEDAGVFGKARINMFYDLNFKSLVVLANPKTIVNDKYAKKEIKSQVIRADQLISKLKEIDTVASMQIAKSSINSMREYGERMLRRNREERKDYFEKFEKLKAEYDAARSEKPEKPKEFVDQSEDMVCPKCGSKLVLRVAKKGENAGNQFYGCSAFPKCRYTQNLEI
ncbi:MAG: NERD domain-containing protein [Lachnospiraceae bacterium]|nr:NERD domain-containing protein [Lachnospiraceae bacterium]